MSRRYFCRYLRCRQSQAPTARRKTQCPFVRQVKHKGTEIGERYADGGGMYLRVKAAGKY